MLPGGTLLPEHLLLVSGLRARDTLGLPVLREKALQEIFERFDIAGPDVLAAHPRPNENAWLLGYAAMRDGSLTTQQEVGLVGAKGVKPPQPTSLSRSFGRCDAEVRV